MFTHEYDPQGNHRLTVTRTAESGWWAGYRDFAWFTLDNRTYICATDYFAGNFNPDEVYELKALGVADTAQSIMVEVPNGL